ncbi:MAG: polymerase subunit delta [Moraxellaceae bacterium]|jgi:DNA polymerase-3 subunit delta'|nr:polymerase subunit delta [Moraxellaceae bacterium]
MSEGGARIPYPFHAYAWQQEIWQRLTGLATSSRLPHALLLAGPAGIGKGRLAQAFTAWLLCHAAQPQGGCGRCKSCSLLAAGTHPDILTLAPETDPKTEKTAKVIKVDQVREVVDFAEKSAQLGGYRVVHVEPAHLLNVQAANALLKTLEEPGRQTLIMLLSSQPLSLPATIRSRCQQVALPLPSQIDALAWLAPQLGSDESARLLLGLADGAPLAALVLRDSLWFGERERLLKDLVGLREGRAGPLAVAQRWHGLGAEAVLQALASIAEDIALLASGATVARHRDLAPIIAAVARQVTPAGILRFRQGLAEKQRLLSGNIQGNVLLDATFSEWGRLAQSRPE